MNWHRCMLASVMVATVVGVGAVATADEPTESPLKKAAVGDWVEFQGWTRGVGPAGKSDVLLSVRYTVASKTNSTAKLKIASWNGDRELPEREIELPLDASVDLALVAPTSKSDIKVTLEKKIPNAKFKIKAKEFAGVGYQYKIDVDLFGGLGFGRPPEGKGIEMSLSYLISPDAPVLGIAVMTMKGITPVRFELSDGTGVSDLLYPSAPPKPKQPHVEEWLEYRGVNQPDGREIVLRHRVKERLVKQTKMEMEFSVAGEVIDHHDFEMPLKSQLDYVPHWPELGDLKLFKKVRTMREKPCSVTIMNDQEVAANEYEHTITFDKETKAEPITFDVIIAEAVPITRVAQLYFRSGEAVDVWLTLAAHSDSLQVDPMATAKSRRANTKSKSKSSEEGRPQEKAATTTKAKAGKDKATKAKR